MIVPATFPVTVIAEEIAWVIVIAETAAVAVAPLTSVELSQSTVTPTVVVVSVTAGPPSSVPVASMTAERKDSVPSTMV